MSPNQESSNSPQNNKQGQVVVRQTASFSGPLPPPQALEGYEKILPGLADRIVKMAESQSEHRKKLESSVIKFDKLKSTLGLIFAFTIVIVALFVGMYVAISGQPLAGSIFSLIPLGTIVGAFIYQRRGKSGEKEE